MCHQTSIFCINMSISATTHNRVCNPPSSNFLFSPLQTCSKSLRFQPNNRLTARYLKAFRAPMACESPPLPGPESSPMNLADVFFKQIEGAAPPTVADRNSKITVVGVGNVGMAIAQTILTQDLTDELSLVDIQPDKLRGEMLDLQHAAAFLPRTKISASTDYAVTAGSDVCVITAGARQREGESRLALVERNFNLFHSIVPELVKYSPDAILLVVSNPVDVLTYITWKLSGFPANRVVGSGTNLDSSRFRFTIADHLDVNAQDVQAYIVGEHGDSSVALWSTITVGGVPITSFLEKEQIAYEKETLETVHRAVVNSAYEVIRLKGYTSWAIGYSAASLVRSLMRDQRRIHPVSVLAKGFYGIEDEVFLSLPAQLGRGGVLAVANIPFTDEEAERLQMSARTIVDVQKQLGV
uniref:L-lactate dehydrogenase n=1 Tax=Wollemia nobilis TaxID=56998 RepID=A0A0C9QVJ9_9CONI